jgi:hypothetical protein
MIVRIFTFQVAKKNQPKLIKFMQHDGGWGLLECIPHLRGAYLLNNRTHKNEFLWITIWTSQAGLNRAIKSNAWKRLYVREVESGVIFGGTYHREHFDVLCIATTKPKSSAHDH